VEYRQTGSGGRSYNSIRISSDISGWIEDGGAQAQQASPPSATGTASAAEAARRLSFAAQPFVPVVVKLHRVANRHGTLVAN
jgi:hypothetical protein